MTQPKTERQAELLKFFEFACECTACIEDYPMPDKLRRIDKTFILPKFGNFPSNELLLKELRENLQYMNYKIDNHPCFETVATLVRTKELIRTICERVSFPF
jgi:hypothetical protein